MLVQTPPTGGREARLRYVQGSYMLLSPGDYVLCAVSGVRIALADLRYWNVEFQEAYASAVHATGAQEARQVRG
jgi:hypothetical protein